MEDDENVIFFENKGYNRSFSSVMILFYSVILTRFNSFCIRYELSKDIILRFLAMKKGVTV